MPENPANKPYAYDRCAELGIKPPGPKEADVTRDEVETLKLRILNLEAQLASFTAAKSPV